MACEREWTTDTKKSNFVLFFFDDKLFLKDFGIRSTLDPTCLTEKGSETEAFLITCHNNKNKKII